MSNVVTAIKVQQATAEAIHDEVVMLGAKDMICQITGSYEMPSDEIILALFKYSAILSANVATRVTTVLMTEGEFNSMCNELREFDEMGRGVFDE